MNATPVRLGSLRKVKDCLTGELSLVVGVLDARGKLQEQVYGVRRGEAPGAVELVKEDGEVHTVSPGGMCSCGDAKYRKRPTACKHAHACRLSGLLAWAATPEGAPVCVQQ